MRTASVLFVCMGNICRSPTAEAVFRHQAKAAGLLRWIEIDSAGTHSWHAGAAPDARSQWHAARRGYDLSQLRARAVQPADFERFDLLLAMDWDNLALLEDACPAQHQRKLRRLMEFAPAGFPAVVPDPYQGGPEGFEHVLDLVENASTGLLDFLRIRIGNNQNDPV